LSAAIGIDLGTSQCCVCAVQGGEIVVVPSVTGTATTPAWTAFQPNGVVVGHAAERMAELTAESAITGVKRLLGRKFYAPETSWLKASLSVPLVAATNGDAWVRVGGLDRSPQEVLSYLLEHLKRRAEEVLDEPVDSAVITVPAFFTEPQRRGVIAAAQLAGLAVDHLLHAPTAAALAFAHLHPAEHGRWAVLSLGAGFYDAAVIEADGPHAVRVRSIAGDALLGGDDFDRRIADHLIDTFYHEHGIDLGESPTAMLRIHRAARAVKHQLGQAPRSAPVELLHIVAVEGEPLTLRHPGIERTHFEEMIQEELDRLVEPCAWALGDIGLGTDDLDAIVLAGAMARMPAAVERLAYLFRARPRRVSEPEQLGAMGAAIYAGALADAWPTPSIEDVAPHSVGIKVRGGRFNPIVARNRVVPCSERKVFATARADQKHVVFEIFQGEAELVNDNVYVGRLVVDVGSTGGAAPEQVAVTFGLDGSGMITVGDAGSEHGVQGQGFQPSSGLSDEQVGELLALRAERSSAAPRAPIDVSRAVATLRPPEPSDPPDAHKTQRPSVPTRSMPPHGGPFGPTAMAGPTQPAPAAGGPLRAGGTPRRSAGDPTVALPRSVPPPPPPIPTKRNAPVLSARPLQVADDSLVGTKLGGRYVIEDIIADGGMGRVYLATHDVLNKKFAIKVLHAELANNEDLAARFVREAQAAATIDSQHVVDISDFGRLDDGTGYFVMEYLEGRTLAQLIREHGALEPRLLIDIALQLTNGLSAAHARGIVHRDLKPDNVTLIDRERNPYFCKILDFGIAKAPTSDSGERHTLAGTLLGTPHYMAPEQIDGDDVDARSDLYSLGAVMYEMASGRPPFEAESIVSVLVMHKCDRPAPLSEMAAAIACPPALQAAIMRCLEKDPAARFHSATELHAALKAI
jgi:molecular chaperone DnaK